MSIEKNMNARIQHKHDIEANWNKALNFIPKIGEIIIYDIDKNHNYERIKIGDGITTVNNLDFLLDSKYISSDKADAIKKASGEIVSLTNSVHTPLYGFKLYGKTTQNGTPTPEAPVELVSAGDDGTVDVSVYGKNLFNEAIMLNADGWKYENGFYTGDNTELRTFFKNNPLNIFRPNTRYYFSFWGYSADASKNSRIYIYYTDGTLFDIKDLRNTDLTFCEYVTDEGKSVSHIMIDYGDSATIYLRDFMICESQTATDYEPYKASQTLTVSTPNGLAGIPVTSGGNYTDSNGQQWICDEVDFARGVYVQRVNQIVFKGTNEDWSLGGNSENNYRNYCYQHWLGSDSRYYAGTYTTPCISSHFSHKTSVNSYSGTEIGTTAHGSNIYLRLGLNTQYTDVNQFKSFLAEQYAAGNPLTHIYILATPIETPLSAEQLLAYAALHTNEPNTTIMNDGNAGMEVKYYTPSTAVQMVHSPSDEGKILSIDEHGCVVLSELDAGSIDIDLDGTNNGEINSINADTLGGVPSNNYVLKDELEGLMPDGSNNSSVLYIQQDLTEAQQAQVRENIGIDTYITACIEEALLGGEW